MYEYNETGCGEGGLRRRTAGDEAGQAGSTHNIVTCSYRYVMHSRVWPATTEMSEKPVTDTISKLIFHSIRFTELFSATFRWVMRKLKQYYRNWIIQKITPCIACCSSESVMNAIRYYLRTRCESSIHFFFFSRNKITWPTIQLQ